MAFSGTTVALLVLYGVALSVFIIGTASPQWADIKSDFPFQPSFSTNGTNSGAGDDYVPDDYVESSTASEGSSSAGGESSVNYITDWSVSPFGYTDNNNENFYWIRPNCKIYNEDYDVVGVLSTNGQCDEQRTMQIFALFSCFISFFALVALFSYGAGKGSHTAAAGASLLSSVTGIIAMSIFVDQKEHNRGDFFSAGGDQFDYGYSLGLFTGGWVLALINTFLTIQFVKGDQGQGANLTGIKPIQAVLIFFFFIAFVVIVIGTGSPEWAYRTVDGEIDVSPFGFYVQAEGRFYWLRPNCKIYDENDKLWAPMPTIPTRSLCDEFRTQQVFALFACIFSFFAFVTTLQHAYKKGSNKKPVLFGILTGITGVTAMAVFIDQKDNDRGWFEWACEQTDGSCGGEDWNYGYSIGLFTGGWILATLAGLLAGCSHNDENGGDYKAPNAANTSIQSAV